MNNFWKKNAIDVKHKRKVHNWAVNVYRDPYFHQHFHRNCWNLHIEIILRYMAQTFLMISVRWKPWNRYYTVSRGFSIWIYHGSGKKNAEFRSKKSCRDQQLRKWGKRNGTGNVARRDGKIWGEKWWTTMRDRGMEKYREASTQTGLMYGSWFFANLWSPLRRLKNS